MKKITLVFLFLIGSITSSFGQFTEGFESGIPATWTVINGGDANTWVQWTTAPFVLEGTASALISYSSTAHDDYLITPAITVTAGVNDRFSFWARSFDPDYPEQFDLLVSTTTPDAAGLTTLVDTVAPDSSLGTYVEYSYDLSAYVGQTIYIGMHSTTTDEWRISVDHVVNDTPPTTVPGCAANPVSTPNATCGNFASTISWDAVAGVTGYNLTVGTTSGGTDVVNNVDIGNVVTYNLATQTPGTTYYWTVVPHNAVGPAVGCTENTYTTFASGCYCTSVPTSNDNLGVTNVLLGTTNVPNGDVTYADYTSTIVDFPQGLAANTQITFATGYTYDTNIWIDFNNDFDFDDAGELVKTGIASTATNPTTLDATFTMPVSAPLGQHRMRIGTADSGQVPPAPCYSGTYGVTLDFTVNVTTPPADSPDYANLQWPPTLTFVQGGSGTVYGQVYEAGLTNPAGQAAGINAWVGVSPIGSDTNPNTWTNWTVATYNVDAGNNDEYMASIGSTLAPGTYYYATRFQLNGGAYVYGGIDASNNGNFWDGTTYKSGVLTVTPPPPPANDACTGAIALTPGGVFADYPVDGTVLNATNDADNTPSCAYLNTQNSDVWYSVVVPASGTLTVEIQAGTSNSLGDTTIAAFTGTCGALTEVGCDDDSGTGLLSLMSLTGLTAGDTIYIGVWKWGTTAPSATVNSFKISAYDASLGNSSFDNANFAYYPNPVKNILNLSYNQEISNVEVFNLLGQIVSSNKIGANTAQVDMSNLAKGAYMVKVTSNNEVKTIKVIKE
ncbi:MAG TPA: choice-of-anchor J domain-containing protein [Flavobacterium sp.]|uniref:T9SS-dependent choice-of-anchor J family protein n=1 Tax=Flavobacterium sp. TaxID=239 RepID=UPI002C7DA7AD|nr:choice-of-anchor J domain-containing protein [Flavobacterium sp.]HNP32614.1 choice-of-anchor J domain-containing protein [Flavobacterium sp.]